MNMKWIFPVLALAVGYFGAREWSGSVAGTGVAVIDEEGGWEGRTQSSRRTGGRWEGRTQNSRRMGAAAGFGARLREIEAGEVSKQDRERFFKKWFREDPEAAMEAMRNSRSEWGKNKPHFLLGFLFEDDAKGLEAMGRYLDEIITSGYWHESGFDGEVWRVYDFTKGEELVQKVAGLPESGMKDELLNYVMAGWFFSDQQGARSYLSGLPDEEQKKAERVFLSERLPGWVSRDVEGREWIAGVLLSEGNRDLLTWHGPALVDVMANDDLKGALEWAGEHLGGSVLADAVGRTVRRLSYQDSAKAAEMVDGLFLGGVRAQAAGILVQEISRKDPGAAFDLARSEEDVGMAIDRRTWRSLGSALGRSSPAEARRILSTSEGLDESFQAHAMEQAFSREPEETKRWAEAMQGPKRAESIELVFNAWSAWEREKAKAWRDGLTDLSAPRSSE
jgi:hypothetical protein